MPRNGGGVMSIPNTFVDQTPITAGAHNTNWSDAASEISNSVAVDGQSQMTGQFKAASGAVTAPGMAFASDLDSGWYRIGGDNLGCAAGGAKVLDVSAAGLGVTGAVSSTSSVSSVDGVLSTPVGMLVDFAGTSAPSLWLLCYGQAISRTTYATLFGVIGTTFGVGDASTTFNLPDCRGRVAAGKDDMGGSSANRLTALTGGLNGDTLGATGGAEAVALAMGDLPASAPTVSSHSLTAAGQVITTPVRSSVGFVAGPHKAVLSSGTGDDSTVTNAASAATSAVSGTITLNALGSGTSHNNVQPTIVFSKIIFAGA